MYLVFPVIVIVTVIVISVFLPCLSIRSTIDFQFGHSSQSKIQYQNLFVSEFSKVVIHKVNYLGYEPVLCVLIFEVKAVSSKHNSDKMLYL